METAEVAGAINHNLLTTLGGPSVLERHDGGTRYESQTSHPKKPR